MNKNTSIIISLYNHLSIDPIKEIVRSIENFNLISKKWQLIFKKKFIKDSYHLIQKEIFKIHTIGGNIHNVANFYLDIDNKEKFKIHKMGEQIHLFAFKLLEQLSEY